MYDILEEPTGDVFRRLLEYGAKCCSHILLVSRPTLSFGANAHQTLTALEPHLEWMKELSSWPGTVLFGQTASVRCYRLNPDVVRTVGGAAIGLYDWRQPNLPEDLSLVRADGRPWLVSIAHERDAYLDISPDELTSVMSEVHGLRLGRPGCNSSSSS